jgi:hypothetical protein
VNATDNDAFDAVMELTVGALGVVDGTAEPFVLQAVVPTCGFNPLFQPATLK